jgi:hypothetical protein
MTFIILKPFTERPAGWRTGNAPRSYSGDIQFESRPQHPVYWRFFVVFFGPFRQIRGRYVDQKTTSSFQIPSYTSPTSHPTTRCYAIWNTDGVV